MSQLFLRPSLHKKWSFPLRIFLGKKIFCHFCQIWSHLLKKSLMEKFTFCAVNAETFLRDIFCASSLLTLLRINLFGAPHGWGAKRLPLPKICHRYPIVMKFGTAIPYLKKIQTIYKWQARPFSSAYIIISSPEISNFFYIKNTDTDCVLTHNF